MSATASAKAARRRARSPVHGSTGCTPRGRRLRWIAAHLAALAVVASMIVGSAPVSSESTAGPAIDLTGELVAKRDGVITLAVTAAEEHYATPSPPAVGDRFEVRIGRDARFLNVGQFYRVFVFDEGGSYSTSIRTIVHTDGSPISTGLIRWREVWGALAIVVCALVGLAGYRIYCDQHPRPRSPFS